MSTATLSPYTPTSLAEAEAFAARLAKSPLMPDALKDRPGDVLIIMAAGHELGLSPMAAIRGLYIINGRVGIMSGLAVSLVKKHGSCEHFTLVESNDLRATYKTKRKGEAETTLTFTIDQAKQAGYLNKGPWRATPGQMLRARAARALAEAVYPDALYGMPWDGDDSDEQLAAQTEPKTIEQAAVVGVVTGTVEALPAAHSDIPAPPAEMQVAPAQPDPVADMLGLIYSSNTLAGLRKLAGPIKEQKLGAHPEIRDAFAARQGQLHRAGGTR